MKKFLSLAAIAAVAMLTVSCDNNEDENGSGTGTGTAPVISLVGSDIDAVHEITPTMSVKVNVKAEEGIDGFGIKIESPALTSEMLEEYGLAAEMDLVNPTTEAMATTLKSFGFPVGSGVKEQTSLTFDISRLVPLIAALYSTTSDHNFELTVTDQKSQKTVKTLKFHLTGTNTITYNEDADLWANTATLKVKLGDVAAEPDVEYKKSTDSEWQKAGLTQNEDGTYTAKIEPAWIDHADHASGAEQCTLDGKTGVFAGHTYEYRLMNGGKSIGQGTFTTAEGQKIPGGNMERWNVSQVEGFAGPVDIYAPVADDESQFWGSGNNLMTSTLCLPDTLVVGSSHAAKLKGMAAFGAVFAAGNLFTGVFDFDMENYNGYARFGQKYEFTVRPTALKVRHKSVVGKIGFLGLKEGQGVTTEDMDRGRIFVCITEWTAPHSVMSGIGAMQDPTAINAFDPEVDAQTDEGKILAYGLKWIETSVGEWTELTIPIIYKKADRATKPAVDKFTLSISAAASAYGDYLCGGLDNELELDDFEWVY